MTLTKVSGGILQQPIDVGIITATSIQVGSGTTIHDTGIDLGSGNITSHNINSTGIVTSTGLDVNGNGDISGDLSVSGNVSIGGTLTYEDVTNIDSVGIITARSDVHVGSALSVTGISTFGNSLHVTSGSVGIGTDNPGNDLEIASSGNGKGLLVTKNGVNSTFLGHNGSGNEGLLILRENGNNKIQLYAESGQPSFINSGNLGIGTANPGSNKLQIQGSSAFYGNGGASATWGDTSYLGALSFDGSAQPVIRAASSKALVFQVDQSTEALRITSDGKIGINQTSPSEKLEVYAGDILLSSNANGVSGGIGPNAALKFEYNGHQYAKIVGNGRDSSGYGDIDFYTSSGTGVTNLTQRMTIRADGNVGVGDDDPSVPFNVKAGGASFAGQTTHVKIEDTTSLAANVGGLLAFEGVYNTNGDPACYAMIHAGKTNADNGNYAGYLRFLTRPSNALPQERLRIKSDGALSIGKGDESGAVENLVELYVGANDGSHATIRGKYNRTNEFNRSEVRFGVQNNANGKGFLAFATGTNSASEKMRITADGNIGIGTVNSTPNRLLHLKAASSTAYSGGSDTADYNFLKIENTTDDKSAGVFFLIGSNGEAAITATEVADGNTDIAFQNRGGGVRSEKVRITSSGKVGINNTNPQTTLNVQGTISTGRNLAREVGTVINYSAQFNSSRSASNVINGKKNYENGSNDWLTPGNARDNAWVVIDLGAQYEIDRVVIYNQNEYDNSKREVKRFNLEGSNDNSSWTLLIDDELGKSDAHEPNPGFSFRLPHVSSPGGMHDDNEGSSYRYWKFHMKDFHGTDPYGGIMEIELYGASNAVDSEVSTHSLVASDVYTQTLSAQRLAIGENGALGEFRANANENIYINAAARFGQNTADSSGNATRHTGWRMYGYCPAGVSSRNQWTLDGFHGRKSFYYYFPHNTSNQAIRFHSNRNSFWTCGFITINAQYSNQNAAGMLRYYFTHNANGGTSYGKTITQDVNIGSTGGNFQMSQSYSFKSWGSNGGSATSHALELRHLTSTGNGVYITIELYGNHLYNIMDDIYMTTGHSY